MTTSPARLWFILGVALGTAALILALRHAALPRLQDDLTAHYAQRLAALPTDQAVAQLRRLSASPDQSLPLLVRALADERPRVRSAASAELTSHIEGWQTQPQADRSKSSAALASALANLPPQLALPERALTHRLAHIVLQQPLDGRLIDVAQVIVDCQRVLDLPCEEPPEVRVATATAQQR